MKGWVVVAKGSKVVSAQLRVGDGDIPSYRLNEILAKIGAARQLAGLSRLLFLPSHDQAVNDSIRDYCSENGIEVYFWYKVLSDNDIVPENNEVVEDAWGKRGVGESGLWNHIFNGEEVYLFSCPANTKYNQLVLNRCRQSLAGYDGLFVDFFGYPLATLGFEALFSCFCPSCQAADPRVADWRRSILDLREMMVSCTDSDLKKWGTFDGIIESIGLMDWARFRTGLVSNLVGNYADAARERGIPLGVDILAPALAGWGGHDYQALGKHATWLKPRIYCRVHGPSSIPLEYYCAAMGLKKWARRLTMPAILQFIGRSIGLTMPENLHNLTPQFLPDQAARDQIVAAVAASDAPMHPSIECSLHPDYESGLTEEVVRGSVEAARDAEGIVLGWNLLYVPDQFLKVVGDAVNNG